MDSPCTSLDSWVTAASQLACSPASPSPRRRLQQGSSEQQPSTADHAPEDAGAAAAGCTRAAAQQVAQHGAANTARACGLAGRAPAPSPGSASVTSSVASADLEAAVQRLGLGCHTNDEASPAPSPAAATPQENTAAPLHCESADSAQPAAGCEACACQGGAGAAALLGGPHTAHAAAEARSPCGGAPERGPGAGPGGGREAVYESLSPASRMGREAVVHTPCGGAQDQGLDAWPGTHPRAWHTPSSRAALEAVALQGLGVSRRMGHRRSVQSAPASPAASASSCDSGLSGAASPLAALAWTAGRANGSGLGFSMRRRTLRDDGFGSSSDSGDDGGGSAARATATGAGSRRGARGAAPGSGLAAALRMLSMAPPCAAARNAQEALLGAAPGGLAGAARPVDMAESGGAGQGAGRGSPGQGLRPGSTESSPSPLTAPNTAARRHARLADSDASVSPRSPTRAPGLAEIRCLVDSAAPDSSPSPVAAPNTAARRRACLADSDASVSPGSPAVVPGAVVSERLVHTDVPDTSPSPVPAPDTAARRRARLADSGDSDSGGSGREVADACGAYRAGPPPLHGQADSFSQGSQQAGAYADAWSPLGPPGDASEAQGLGCGEAARAAAAGAPPCVRRGPADLFGAGLGCGVRSVRARAVDPYAYPGEVLADPALPGASHTPAARCAASQARQEAPGEGASRAESRRSGSAIRGHEGQAGGAQSESGRSSGGSSPIMLSSSESESEGEGEGEAACGGVGVQTPAGGQENRLHGLAGAVAGAPPRRLPRSPRQPFGNLAGANAGAARPGSEQRAAGAAEPPCTPVGKALPAQGTRVRRSHAR